MVTASGMHWVWVIKWTVSTYSCPTVVFHWTTPASVLPTIYACYVLHHLHQFQWKTWKINFKTSHITSGFVIKSIPNPFYDLAQINYYLKCKNLVGPKKIHVVLKLRHFCLQHTCYCLRNIPSSSSMTRCSLDIKMYGFPGRMAFRMRDCSVAPSLCTVGWTTLDIQVTSRRRCIWYFCSSSIINGFNDLNNFYGKNIPGNENYVTYE